MRISEISDTIVDDGQRELSATLHFEGHAPDSVPIWIRRPDPGPSVRGLADPLFAASLIPAMALGEELVIEGPVSSDLMKHAREDLMPTLMRWHPRLEDVAIITEESCSPATPAADGKTAALFSGGVDSWFTLVEHADTISHLIHIRGFEIEADDDAAWATSHAAVRKVAERRGKQILAVATNLHDVMVRQHVKPRLTGMGRPWKRFRVDAYFGSMLVGVALSLRPGFRRLFIPASWSEQISYPVASHRLMEPSMSTEAMEIDLSGFDQTRLDKIRSLVSSTPEAFEDLRVCAGDGADMGGFLNCGRCIKCVRTMIEMRVCGARYPEHLFRHPLDLAFARRTRYIADEKNWRDLRYVASQLGDREVADTVSIILDEKFHLPRLMNDLARVIRRRSFKLRDVHWPWRSKESLENEEPIS